MSTRKVSRHDMKHDDFVSGVGQATVWIESHWQKIGIAAAGLVATLLLAYGVWVWRDSRAAAGEEALASVERAFDAAVGADDGAAGRETFPTSAAKFQAILERADRVVAEHGSTSAAERARFLKGLALFESGDLGGARRTLEEFVDRNPRHFLAAQARRKIAETFEREQNFDEACRRYRELAESPVAELPAEVSLLDVARCENARGHKDEATATCRRVVDEFPDSPYAADARTMLLDLGQS